MVEHRRQYCLRCEQPEEKYVAIQQIVAYLQVEQAIICCRSKATVRELNIRMSNDGHSVRELTAVSDVDQQALVIKEFRDGLFRILITTNITLTSNFDRILLC